MKEIADLIGKKYPVPLTILDRALNAPVQALEMVHDAVFTNEAEASDKFQGSEGDLGNFQNLTSGEKIIVEEIEKKAARLLFKTKFRFIYLSRKEVTNNYQCTYAYNNAKTYSFNCRKFRIKNCTK